MYILFAVFLLLHGFAHLVGFVGPWGLSSSVQLQSTLLAGRISIGMMELRAIGIFWLGGALAFTAAAVGIMRHAPWWPAFTFSQLSALSDGNSVFATGGRELQLRPETLQALAAPAVPATHGFYDECLYGDMQYSLGFKRGQRALRDYKGLTGVFYSCRIQASTPTRGPRAILAHRAPAHDHDRPLGKERGLGPRYP